MPLLTVFNPRKKRQARKNPPANVLSTEALEIMYVHAADGKRYVHKFAPGVTIKRLPDGSARIYRPDGKPVLKFF